jgi:OmpA-OmpF porin, OOP family
MRLSAFVIPLAAFLIAGMASAFAAVTAVAVVEDRSVEAVREELQLQGHDWAQVLGDGLQIVMEGTAPSEAVRFRAISIAGSVVDASRVIDNMAVTEAANIVPPAFAMEILRNDSGVSLIGLVPASTDREAVTAQIMRIAGDLPVTDLLEVADYPVPQGWRSAMTFALNALGQLPHSKISVAPGHVSINAISDSIDQKRRLEATIARQAPEGVQLALAITAPRPVITPFTTRFVLDEDGARFEACSADTPETEREIQVAAVAAGVEGKITCTQGLGVPSRTWGEAVALGIAAVADLGGGTVTYSDADVVLVALEGTSQDDFDRVAGELENALPDLFALDAVLPVAAEATAEGLPQFTATLSPEGRAQVRGRVPDALMNSTVTNFASARFGKDNVTMGTRITDDLPSGWSVRVLAGLEALSKLADGSVLVQPDLVAVRGNTGNPDASAAITRLMLDKLGPGAEFRVDVVYVAELDPDTGLPTPQECIEKINAITATRKITFDPGSANLDSATQGVVNDIAEALRRCIDMPIKIAGYTDSQGRDEMNLRLSQQRADAVLTALRGRRVPTSTFTAIGYGEADPIADNATEEGREANRRIEFSLISEDADGDDSEIAEADADAEAETDADAGDAEEDDTEEDGDATN